MQMNLASLDSAPHVDFELHSLEGAGVHARVEDLIARVFGLGLIHRHIGIAQQIFRLPLAGEAESDANARSHRHLDVVEHQRIGKSFEHPLGDANRVLGAAYLLEQDGEFVTPETRHGIFFARALDQSLRHLDQQLITGHVTEAVVDHLESIEIQKKQGERMMAVPLRRRVETQKIVEEKRSVGKTGQGVVKGRAFELRFDPLALGHVDDRHQDTFSPRRMDRALADLDGKLDPVFAQAVEFFGLAYGHALGDENTLPLASGLNPKALGQQDIHRSADQLRSGKTEQLLDLRIDQTNVSVLIDNQDAVRGRFHGDLALLLNPCALGDFQFRGFIRLRMVGGLAQKPAEFCGFRLCHAQIFPSLFHSKLPRCHVRDRTASKIGADVSALAGIDHFC